MSPPRLRRLLLAAALPLAAAAAPAPPTPATAAPDLPQAAPREVHARLTKAQPRLGEPFDWEVEVRHPAAESYALPARLELGPFQAEPLGCRRAPAGGDTLTTCALRLALFELGPHDLPTLRLEAATAEGPARLDVPGPRVEVAGVIDPKAAADALTLREPAAAVPLLLPTWRPVWAALGLAALVALGWLSWRAWRRRTALAAEPPPPLPPGERLARRLDALEAERLAEQGRVREHFFRLSEAVREYVGALTGVNALDLTTGELLEALAAQGDPRVDLEALRGFSEDADLIKFARFPAGGYECEAGLRFARGLLARAQATSVSTSTSTPTSTSTVEPPRGRP